MSSTQTVKDYQNIDEKQKVVYNRLISKGYTPQAAIGILGNLVWESKLKTTQEGDIGYEGGSSFGIAQWRGDRLKRLKSTYGNGWTNLENQVDFLDWELNNTHKIAGKKLRGVTDVHLAGQAFSDDFEVPQKKYNQNVGRRNSVSTIAKKFIGYEPKDYAPQQTTEQDSTPYDTNFTITKIDEEVTPQQQAKQELKDINNEKQLIEDLVNSTFEIPQEKKEQQNYQQSQAEIQEPTLTESYAQIANFIDTPMAQQGGFVKSIYKPTKTKSLIDDEYYADSNFKKEFFKNYIDTNGEVKSIINTVLNSNGAFTEKINGNEYKIDKGKDDKGAYYSFYSPTPIEKNNFSANKELYNRVYESEIINNTTKVNSGKQDLFINYKDYIKNTPMEEVHTNSKIDTEQNNLKEFVGSKKYLEILEKQYSKEDSKNIQEERLQRLENVKYNIVDNIDKRGSGYVNGITFVTGGNPNINYNTLEKYDKGSLLKGLDKNVNNIDKLYFEKKGYTSIPTHEFSHYMTNGNKGLSDRDIKQIGIRTDNEKEYPFYIGKNKLSNTSMDYYRNPMEVQARLNSVRMLLKENGVYNPSEDNFTKKHLDKIKKSINSQKYRNSDLQDLIKTVNSEDDFIWLMNNVVQNETTKIDTLMAQQGGFVVTRSNDRKGKTHKVTASDGTVKYFGDSNLGQHPKDPERKAAFYARHKENLKNNPFFRAFARKTWQEGGEINYEDTFQQGGLQNYFNVIEDQQGQRKFPNQVTKINGNTMATDGYGNIPLYVVPNAGKPRIIFPNTGEHTFKGATNFTEYPIKNQEIPIAQEDIEVKQQVNGAKNITFNQAFKEARVALGANQIFEYNGKKYGTNLKGETFNPSEEVLKNNNLPIQETKERLQKQNTLVDNPYSTKTTVKIEPYYKNWSEIEKEKISFNKMEDADKIIKYKQGDNGSFAIVDKKKGLINIYNSGENKPIFTSAIDLGASKSDAQTTIKYQDINKDGKITDEDRINGKFKVDWSAGNTSTGAGKFYISNIDSKGYEGLPILNMMNEGQYEKFKKTGEIEQVSTSFHKGYIKDDNNRVSNGCIRCNKTTLDNLTKYLKNTSEVYILPEDKNNRFELKDGKLSFKVNASTNYNAYIDSKGIVQKGQGVNRSTNTLQYKPIQISLDEEKFKDKVFQWNDFNDEVEFKNTTKPFIKSLQDSKQKVMKAAKIDGDTYNNIAKVAFGIYGTESNFGDTHSGVGNLLRAVNKVTDSSSSSSPDVRSKATTYGATDNNNSVGYTQIRWSQLNDREKEVLKNLEITSNKDLLNPKKSATATVAILAVRYQEHLTAKQKEDIFNYLPKKWNNRENYSSRVNKNLEYLTIKELVK